MKLKAFNKKSTCTQYAFAELYSLNVFLNWGVRIDLIRGASLPALTIISNPV